MCCRLVAMNEIEKLDAVLRHMASKYPKEQATKKGVMALELIKKFPELNDDVDFDAELYYILQKLINDGYVTGDQLPTMTSIFYSITFNGLYFIKYGDGYQGLETRKNAENIRVQTVESFQRALATKLNDLTRWAVRGAFALLIWEILKFFVFEHHWYLYWPF